MNISSAIGSVIVTYNRLNKLKNALLAYDRQILLPKYIIIVNNASTDGTAEFLKKWQSEKREYKKIVINLPDNIGGSGGFYEGQKAALDEDADWIMLADDDAYPEKNYIDGIQKYIESKDTKNISMLCGKVIQNGTFVNTHRGNINGLMAYDLVSPIGEMHYQKRSFECDVISYVGAVISKEKLIKAGMVKKDYFIWYDDTEHCLRLKKYGKILCVTDVGIVHDIEIKTVTPVWKIYYGFRNQLDLLKQYNFILFLYFIVLLTLKSVLCPLKQKKIIEVKVRLRGIKDGIFGNLGKKDSIYYLISK